MGHNLGYYTINGGLPGLHEETRWRTKLTQKLKLLGLGLSFSFKFITFLFTFQCATIFSYECPTVRYTFFTGCRRADQPFSPSCPLF